MSATRFGRAQRATALVPLALLSAAWTASLAGAGASTTSVSAERAESTLPDGTSVPTEAIEAPASVSPAASLAPGIAGTGAARVVATASTSGIPSAAIAAYQRAETVINAADKSCKLTWQLVAAIGRVESDHGRYAGNTLDESGVATPGIYGIPLNGKRNTQAIPDTDAGQYDDDLTWDRAVGPMQFIPSTWSVVGVDADGDSRRNPQDIDDAALATAVYLCSGNDDLSTTEGQRAAVYRYNHSEEYVDLVLSIMEAYLEGDYMSVPDSSTSAGFFVPDPDYTPPVLPLRNGDVKVPGGGTAGGGNDGGSVVAAPPAPAAPPASSAPAPAPAPAPAAPVPAGGGDDGSQPAPSLPTKTPIKTPSLPPAPSTGVEPVDDTITRAEALVKCAAKGVVDNPLTAVNELENCVAGLVTG